MNCFVCDNKTKLRCSACKNVYYCSIRCQTIDWVQKYSQFDPVTNRLIVKGNHKLLCCSDGGGNIKPYHQQNDLLIKINESRRRNPIIIFPKGGITKPPRQSTILLIEKEHKKKINNLKILWQKEKGDIYEEGQRIIKEKNKKIKKLKRKIRQINANMGLLKIENFHKISNLEDTKLKLQMEIERIEERENKRLIELNQKIKQIKINIQQVKFKVLRNVQIKLEVEEDKVIEKFNEYLDEITKLVNITLKHIDTEGNNQIKNLQEQLKDMGIKEKEKKKYLSHLEKQIETLKIREMDIFKKAKGRIEEDKSRQLTQIKFILSKYQVQSYTSIIKPDVLSELQRDAFAVSSDKDFIAEAMKNIDKSAWYLHSLNQMKNLLTEDQREIVTVMKYSLYAKMAYAKKNLVQLFSIFYYARFIRPILSTLYSHSEIKKQILNNPTIFEEMLLYALKTNVKLPDVIIKTLGTEETLSNMTQLGFLQNIWEAKSEIWKIISSPQTGSVVIKQGIFFFTLVAIAGLYWYGSINATIAFGTYYFNKKWWAGLFSGLVKGLWSKMLEKFQGKIDPDLLDMIEVKNYSIQSQSDFDLASNYFDYMGIMYMMKYENKRTKNIDNIISDQIIKQTRGGDELFNFVPNINHLLRDFVNTSSLDLNFGDPVFSDDLDMNAKYWLIYNEDEETLILSIRGTVKGQDWFFNLNTVSVRIGTWLDNQGETPLEIHKGFNDHTSPLFDKLNENIIQLLLNKPKLKFIITGHSLGAAASNIFFLKLFIKIKKAYGSHPFVFQFDDNDNDNDNDRDILRRVYVYGYGTPPCCSSEVAQILFSNYPDQIINTISRHDLVPRTTPFPDVSGISDENWPFKIPGKLIFLDKNLEGWFIIADPELALKYQKNEVPSASEFFLQTKTKTVFSGVTFLGNHSMANYSSNLMNVIHDLISPKDFIQMIKKTYRREDGIILSDNSKITMEKLIETLEKTDKTITIDKSSELWKKQLLEIDVIPDNRNEIDEKFINDLLKKMNEYIIRTRSAHRLELRKNVDDISERISRILAKGLSLKRTKDDINESIIKYDKEVRWGGDSRWDK